MKRVMMAMACLLLALAVGLVAVMGVAVMNPMGEGGFSLEFFENLFGAKLAKTSRFDGKKLQQIELDMSSDSVTILPATGDEVVLEEYTNRPSKARLMVSEEAGNLHIQQEEQGLQWFSFHITRVKLYVPRAYAGGLVATLKSGSLASEIDLTLASLLVESGSGSIKLQKVESQGAVQLRSKSGSVKAESVSAASLLAESGSGSVRVGQMSGQFTLRSKSGSVHLEEGRGAGVAESRSGSVRLSMVEMTGDLQAIGQSGSVRVELPQGTAVDFMAETSSGSIHTPFDDALQFSKSDHHAEGQVGSAPQHKLRCTSSSGSVRVEWR